MMGIGRVMHSTPQIAHSDATNLPAGVLPAQNIVIVCPNQSVDISFDAVYLLLLLFEASATHRGAMSPYPVLVMVMMAQYSVCSRHVLPRDT